MSKVLKLFIILGFVGSCFASPLSVIKKFEDGYFYFPQEHGLKNLKVNLEINKSKLNFHWSSEGKREVKVLSSKIEDPKSLEQLKGLAIEAMQFVVPVKISQMLKDYSLSYVEGNKNLLKASDKTGTQLTHEYILKFKGIKLDYIVQRRAVGTTHYIYKYQKMASEHVLESVEVKKYEGRTVLKSVFKISYKKQSDILLPDKIDTEIEQEVLRSDVPAQKRKTTQLILFKNYQVGK
jgi:hypothetical protein